MEIFIVLACICAFVGGIGTIAGKLVYQAYSEELQESGNNILPPPPSMTSTSSTPSFPPILDEVTPVLDEVNPILDEVKKN